MAHARHLRAMGAKSEHLQIRVTAREKALLKRAAAAAGQDLSTYVLARAIPPARVRFAELLALLGEGAEHRYALAELNDFLTALAPAELRDAVDHAEMDRLSPFLQNYIAAMVEQASSIKRVQPPAWTAQVAPLDEPWFATSMNSLRLHLLRTSPVPFKRRNIFVDASVGSRV
jgi:hypothetical protein